MKFNLKSMLVAVVLIASFFGWLAIRNEESGKIEKAKMAGYVAGKSVGKIDLVSSWLELSEADYRDYVKRDLILLLESHYKMGKDYHTYIGPHDPLQMSAKILKLLECDSPTDFRKLILVYRPEEDYFQRRYHEEQSDEYRKFQGFLERSIKVAEKQDGKRANKRGLKFPRVGRQ